jgi:hypothetical protein
MFRGPSRPGGMTTNDSLRSSWIPLAIVHGLGLFALVAAALSL